MFGRNIWSPDCSCSVTTLLASEQIRKRIGGYGASSPQIFATCNKNSDVGQEQDYENRNAPRRQ